MSAFHPSWSSPLCAAQDCSTYRAMPNAIPRSCSRPALAYLALVHRQASIHSVSIGLVAFRIRQSIQQAQKSGFAPISHLKVYPPAPVALFHHPSPYPVRIARNATPDVYICPHLVKRYDLLTPTCNCRRARSASNSAIACRAFFTHE